MNKSFIHCPAEDKAEPIIFELKAQYEGRPGISWAG